MFPTPTSPAYGIFVREQVDSLRREGLTVDVFFINGAESKKAYLTAIYSLAKPLRAGQYDLIHAHHTFCIYPLRLAQLTLGDNTPVVLTFHEGEVHNLGQFKPRGLKRLVFSKAIKRAALSQARYIVAVEEALMAALSFRGEYRIIPCGVDTQLFRPLDKDWCRDRLGLPRNRTLIFFPARPGNSQKGFDVLVAACALFTTEQVEIISAGDIPHESMPYYMNAADVVAQPSVFEASSMALKEAMAVNAKVVITPVGDAASVIGAAAGAFLCERTPESVFLALQRALAMDRPPRTRKRLLETELRLQDVAKRTISVYARVLAARQPLAPLDLPF